MGIRIRTKQDDRIKSDGNRLSPSGDTFGRDRIENLYKIVRYILENNRRGWIQSGSLTEDIKHIEMGSRVEQNDKKSRIRLIGNRVGSKNKPYKKHFCPINKRLFLEKYCLQFINIRLI